MLVSLERPLSCPDSRRGEVHARRHRNPPAASVRPDNTYAGKQGLSYFEGIAAETVGSTGICMHLLTIPPGGRAKAHLHEAHETAIYVLSGEVHTWYGDNLEEHIIVSAGDLFYIPAGVPHLPANLSDKPCTAVIARTDPNEQESVVLLPELTTGAEWREGGRSHGMEPSPGWSRRPPLLVTLRLGASILALAICRHDLGRLCWRRCTGGDLRSHDIIPRCRWPARSAQPISATTASGQAASQDNRRNQRRIHNLTDPGCRNAAALDLARRRDFLPGRQRPVDRGVRLAPDELAMARLAS